MQQKVLKSGEQSFKRQNHSIYLGIDKKELNLISKPGQAQVIYGCNDVMGSEVCRARTHKAYNTKVDNMTMEETLNDIGLKEIYLINLPKNKDRLEFTRKQLDKLNLPFTLFEAVDSHKIQEAYETGKPLDSMFHPGIKMNFEKTAKFINDNPHIMQWHRIGCSLSHFSIYLTMIDKAANKDGPILILEDDVIFDWSVKEKIKQGLIEMPSDWEFFAIGSCFPRLEKIPQSNNLFKVYRMWCAHAYILRNSKVAQKLLDRGNTEIWQGADQYWNGMFETNLNAYALWPHVVSQNRENFISLLTPESKLKLFPVENPVTVD